MKGFNMSRITKSLFTVLLLLASTIPNANAASVRVTVLERSILSIQDALTMENVAIVKGMARAHRQSLLSEGPNELAAMLRRGDLLHVMGLQSSEDVVLAARGSSGSDVYLAVVGVDSTGNKRLGLQIITKKLGGLTSYHDGGGLLNGNLQQHLFVTDKEMLKRATNLRKEIADSLVNAGQVDDSADLKIAQHLARAASLDHADGGWSQKIYLIESVNIPPEVARNLDYKTLQEIVLKLAADSR